MFAWKCSGGVASFVDVGEGSELMWSERPVWYGEIKYADVLFINHTRSVRYTAGSTL